MLATWLVIVLTARRALVGVMDQLALLLAELVLATEMPSTAKWSNSCKNLAEATAPLLESKPALDLTTMVTPVVRVLNLGIVDQLETLLPGDLAIRTRMTVDHPRLPGLETEATATVVTVTVEIVVTEVIAAIEATVATAAVTATTTTTRTVDTAATAVAVAALLHGSRIIRVSSTPSITPREPLMGTLATLRTEPTARLLAWEHLLVWAHPPAWALLLAFLKAVPLLAWITSTL